MMRSWRALAGQRSPCHLGVPDWTPPFFREFPLPQKRKYTITNGIVSGFFIRAIRLAPSSNADDTRQSTNNSTQPTLRR
ncbi:hypothetical protein NPIL_507371 [Nephila pilipes]|uniref:Uncharacterized protein n=1 Tax=Nephila pilipes TaxID=299642 RepID=A0A8X6IRC9_NEPPI|nr:hypothetical protein NPIL_507371 [Nephila pilipes]